MTIGVLVKPASNEFSLEGKFGEIVLLAKRLLIDENFVPHFLIQSRSSSVLINFFAATANQEDEEDAILGKKR